MLRKAPSLPLSPSNHASVKSTPVVNSRSIWRRIAIARSTSRMMHYITWCATSATEWWLLSNVREYRRRVHWRRCTHTVALWMVCWIWIEGGTLSLQDWFYKSDDGLWREKDANSILKQKQSFVFATNTRLEMRTSMKSCLSLCIGFNTSTRRERNGSSPSNPIRLISGWCIGKCKLPTTCSE